ncbi:hypothetical protein [Sinorhizobium fredii]|uniref:hypothetical protein n=1 Tax=Rhizobium fredii TaxID=380 RepID=UPI0012976F32|nr:hypothetical protein [Sinorhizobium fredii]MQW93996.1 hypothetical protein [Sinorhizobium fredii]
MDLNEIGDFLAGVFSPLAFMLLVVTLVVQHGELVVAQHQFAVEREDFASADKAEKRRLEDAARLRLAQALLRLTEHWETCFLQWHQGYLTNVQQVPDGPLNEIIDLAADIPNPSFESFQKLVAKVQMFEARISAAKKNISDPETNVRNFDRMLIDLAELSYLTFRLFEYARFEVDAAPYAPPTYALLYGAVCEPFADAEGDVDEHVLNRIEEALKRAIKCFGGPPIE